MKVDLLIGQKVGVELFISSDVSAFTAQTECVGGCSSCFILCVLCGITVCVRVYKNIYLTWS